MIRTGITLGLVLGVALAVAAPAQADTFTFTDCYWGGTFGGAPSTVDSTGPEFDIMGIEVVTGNNATGSLDSLTVTFTTDQWAQRFSTGKSGWTFPEDIFIDLGGYVPPCDAASANDSVLNHGGIWDYVVHVRENGTPNPATDDTGVSYPVYAPPASGNIDLYNWATGTGTTFLSQDTWAFSDDPGSYYRSDQQVRYVPGATETALASGSWALIGSPGNYTGIQYSLTGLGGLGIDFSTWSLKWAMTCANDVIFVNENPIPEPGSALLVLGGLATGFVARRRRKAKLV